MQIQKPKLSEIMPPSLQSDERLMALAKALDFELEKLSAECELVLHLPRLNELPHEILDHLAHQYHVDFYSSDYSLQMKRQMLRETFYLHRIKGTPAAVEKFLSAIMKNPVVEEFFEYAGEPYYFRIKTGGLFLEIDSEEEFLRLINHAKNLRSWLESITFDLTIEESHLLSVAGIIQYGGEIFTDIKQPTGETFNFFHAINENISGIEKTNLAENFQHLENKFHTIIEKNSGMEITKADYEFNEKWLWKYLLLEKWRNFKNNPVIEIYFHHKHGDENFETDSVTKYYYSATEKISGYEIIDVSLQSFENPDAKNYVGFTEQVAGIEITDADFTPTDEIIFKNILLSKWKDFKNNPVIEFYKHRNHGEEIFEDSGVIKNYYAITESVAGFEITNTEFTYYDEDEPLPKDQDFLRLYFDCGTGFKNLTLYNPKINLTKTEINPVSDYIIENKILQNKKGDSVKKLIKALLFYKSADKIF